MKKKSPNPIAWVPTVTYFESPVVVDNLTNEIISNP